VPVWRTLLFGSIITFIGGMTVFLSFMTGESELLGSDAGSLQTFFGAVMLGSLVICLITQIFCAERLQEAIGIPGVLIILPVMTVLAGLLLAVGIVLQSLPLLALGLACWFIPRWSIDENARRGALALVPDERRTRVSFIVDLLPISTGLIIAGPLAAIAYLTGYLWAIPLLGAIITVFAIPLAFKVKRGWEDSLMNWRLRRRKQNRTLALGEE
jgi:type IV secretory pathway TrbD component